mmetsp:Transcript_10835/g.21773  ORF Transcript_10835/g.21773 Transcript_10835/m.21773 type:complete len:220 (-) Transcript_10835:57-716(-)
MYCRGSADVTHPNAVIAPATMAVCLRSSRAPSLISSMHARACMVPSRSSMSWSSCSGCRSSATLVSISRWAPKACITYAPCFCTSPPMALTASRKGTSSSRISASYSVTTGLRPEEEKSLHSSSSSSSSSSEADASSSSPTKSSRESSKSSSWSTVSICDTTSDSRPNRLSNLLIFFSMSSAGSMDSSMSPPSSSSAPSSSSNVIPSPFKLELNLEKLC